MPTCKSRHPVSGFYSPPHEPAGFSAVLRTAGRGPEARTCTRMAGPRVFASPDSTLVYIFLCALFLRRPPPSRSPAFIHLRHEPAGFSAVPRTAGTPPRRGRALGRLTERRIHDADGVSVFALDFDSPPDRLRSLWIHALFFLPPIIKT